MTSLQFFDYRQHEIKPSVDWGRIELQSSKFDPTLIRAPTYLLKNQPETQFYRESNLELSNVRDNDQLMKGVYKENLLEKQILRKFPMEHPMTSQISYKAVFPSFTAPEDENQGEAALHLSKYILNEQTPAQVDKTIVVNKFSGKPWRQEIRLQTLPTQKNGKWYNDKELYHLPKPHQSQQYYPAPPTLLVPNPRLRAPKHTLDARTANVLRNKEKQLNQTTQRTDYYADGLGTRAPLNSDDLLEKKEKYEKTHQLTEGMKPFFRKGDGLTQATIKNLDPQNLNSSGESVQPTLHLSTDPPKKLMTNVEKDEVLMEKGKDYHNFPASQYKNIPQVPVNHSLTRAYTMPNLNEPTPLICNPPFQHAPPNKLDLENKKIIQENHDRIVKLQYENRQKDISLIKPESDIKMLRLKSKELEKSRGPAQATLKQNVHDHINILYDQESKYLGERAELYKTQTYNPYLLKQYVESVKPEPTISANYTDYSGVGSQKNVYITEEKHERNDRPKLFADKVYNDHKNLKRAPLENILLNPNLSTDPKTVQENGFILKQSTYGESYNTKKYLQENEIVGPKRTSDSVYRSLSQAELDHQNIVLRTRVDQVALSDYQNGITQDPRDMRHAQDLVDKIDKEKIENDRYQYPRLVGPIPPEPYEVFYCSNEISEMSDGYKKPVYSRVYDSPHLTKNPNQEPQHQARYEPLRSDLQAMRAYESNEMANMVEHQQYLDQMKQDVMNKSIMITHRDLSRDKTNRRATDKITKHIHEQMPTSTYASAYTPYTSDSLLNCPPNQFYKNIEYTENFSSRSSDNFKSNLEPISANLGQMQDKWSKTLANKRYHSAYVTNRHVDLRDNINAGKKIIREAPANAARFA